MSSLSPAQVYHLTYSSTMTLSARMRSSTFSDIADTCQKNNALAGIHGFILFKHGKFLQYLEGDELSILNLYQVIRQDTRHKNVQLLSQGSGVQSRFSQQTVYHFDTLDDTTGEEITALMEEFDTYNWTVAETEQIIMDFARYDAMNVRHREAYAVKVESYLFTVAKQFLRRHLVFIMVQVFFLLIFLVLGWYLFS